MLGLDAGKLTLFALIGFLPATGVAIALVDRAVTSSFGAMTRPGLELTAGVPLSLRTLIAVSTLLTSEADMLEQIERLEIHHLAGAGGDLYFVLLSDGVDAEQETLEGDADKVREALEREAWDGEWYRRATFDDGTWLGSKESEECRIDSIAQSWAVLPGVADPGRASAAMVSLE